MSDDLWSTPMRLLLSVFCLDFWQPSWRRWNLYISRRTCLGYFSQLRQRTFRWNLIWGVRWTTGSKDLLIKIISVFATTWSFQLQMSRRNQRSLGLKCHVKTLAIHTIPILVIQTKAQRVGGIDPSMLQRSNIEGHLFVTSSFWSFKGKLEKGLFPILIWRHQSIGLVSIDYVADQALSINWFGIVID